MSAAGGGPAGEARAEELSALDLAVYDAEPVDITESDVKMYNAMLAYMREDYASIAVTATTIHQLQRTLTMNSPQGGGYSAEGAKTDLEELCSALPDQREGYADILDPAMEFGAAFLQLAPFRAANGRVASLVMTALLLRAHIDVLQVVPLCAALYPHAEKMRRILCSQSASDSAFRRLVIDSILAAVPGTGVESGEGFEDIETDILTAVEVQGHEASGDVPPVPAAEPEEQGEWAAGEPAENQVSKLGETRNRSGSKQKKTQAAAESRDVESGVPDVLTAAEVQAHRASVEAPAVPAQEQGDQGGREEAEPAAQLEQTQDRPAPKKKQTAPAAADKRTSVADKQGKPSPVDGSDIPAQTVPPESQKKVEEPDVDMVYLRGVVPAVVMQMRRSRITRPSATGDAAHIWAAMKALGHKSFSTGELSSFDGVPKANRMYEVIDAMVGMGLLKKEGAARFVRYTITDLGWDAAEND